MSGELNDFLKEEEAEPEAAAVVAEPAAAEPEAAAEGAAEPEAAPAPGDSRTVPLAALEGERKARQDWKEKALVAEGEMAELRRQLEEARKPPSQSAPVAQPIDPSVDPQGFVGRVQEVMLNERLNTSEMMVRKELGGEKVDAMIAEFKTLAQADPALFAKLYQQPHPYEWAHKEVEKAKALREIGEDPAAYRARIRAEIEAEIGAAPTAEAARPALPGPSLATARNAAPRSAPAFSGPDSIEDILSRK